MASRIVVVGGHGKVALHFARLASSKYDVHSIVRSEEHFSDITSRGAKPELLSLEEASTEDLKSVFQGSQAVVFSAGAGGKGGEQRTKAVDLLGAIKVFDSIEKEDIKQSKKAHDAIGLYYDCKLEADRNLRQRTAFPWVILRPGHLLDEPGKGKIDLGTTHMGGVPREDVARTLLHLIDAPGKGATGLTLDLITGNTPIEEAVSAAIKEGKSAFTD